MGPTWGPPGSCRPQVGPMLAPWVLLSRVCYCSMQQQTAFLSAPGGLLSHIFNHRIILDYAGVAVMCPSIPSIFDIWAPLLTHWGQDKMAAISQMTLSNAFSWMKIYAFWLRFHWSVFLRVKLTIFQLWFRYWLGADQATTHYLNQWWLDYRRIYTSLVLNDLSCVGHLSNM